MSVPNFRSNFSDFTGSPLFVRDIFAIDDTKRMRVPVLNSNNALHAGIEVKKSYNFNLKIPIINPFID